MKSSKDKAFGVWLADLGRLVQVALLLAFFSLLAMAQMRADRQGTILGTISDPNGARIVNAPVSLTGGNNLTRNTVSDANGNYSFPGLPPGRYALTFAAEGFVIVTRPADVALNSIIRLDVTLQVNVVITDPVAVMSERNDLAVVTLSGAKLNTLPSDPRQLLLRLKRLAGATGPGEELAVYVDGQRETGPLPAKEAIQSIRFSHDSFAAEFSEPGRGRVEIFTKPATEDWHGEVGFNFNDESINARNPFAANRPAEQIRNWSASLGGPLVKNRWGYFVSFDRRAQDENSIINATTLNPVTFTPQPLTATFTRPARATDFTFRTDYLLRSSQTLRFRYRYSGSNEGNQGLDDGFSLPSRVFSRNSHENTFRASLVSVFSEQALNEAFIELGRRRAQTRAADTTPGVEVLDTFTGGGQQSAAESSEVARSLSLQNNLTFARGRHTIKFGGQANATQYSNFDRANFAGAFTFGTDLLRDNRGLPRLVNGAFVVLSPLERYANTVQRLTGYRASQFTLHTGDPFIGLTQWETGFFAQDTWQLKPRVTLSYGLRSELQTHLPDKLNLAPRLSLAVQPFKGMEGVLRVGAGLFYERFAPELTIETNRFDGARQQDLLIQRPGFFAVIPQTFNPALTQLTLHTKAPGLNAPYALLASASWEQPLPGGLNVSAGYSFQQGSHLLRLRNLNAPIDGLRPQAEVGPILQYEATGRSRRHEFNLSLSGEKGEKLSFYSSYRLSFTDSDTDGPFTAPANSYNLSREWGRAAIDQRHQFYLEGYIMLPLGLTLSPNLFAASGAPFDITTGSDDNGDSFFTDRPAFAVANTAGAITTAYGIFNPTPAVGDNIIARNLGRGPQQFSLNLNISRSFNFGGEKKATPATGRRNPFRRPFELNLTVDAYNLLNHTNLGQFNGILGTSLFGRANYAEDSRRINIGVSLGF